MEKYIITLETTDGRTSSVDTDYLQGALNIADVAKGICKERNVSATISVFLLAEYGKVLIETETINPTRVVAL